jgi:hypothetical protein
MLKTIIALAVVLLSGMCLIGVFSAAVVWAIRLVERMVACANHGAQYIANDVPMLKTVVHVLQAMMLGGFGLGVWIFQSSDGAGFGHLFVGFSWMVAAILGIYKAERRIKELEDKDKFK